jgi:hypothetical protein
MPDKKDEPQVEDKPIVVKVEMAKKPVVAPDGHVNLSQEDIDGRD